MTEPIQVRLYGSRGAGKTQALIESLLAQANERGIRVEIVHPQGEPSGDERDMLSRLARRLQVSTDEAVALFAAAGFRRTTQGEPCEMCRWERGFGARKPLEHTCDKRVAMPEPSGTVRGALVVQQSFLRGGADRVEVDACAACGAIIFDVTLHNEWHADRTVGHPEPRFKVGDLVRVIRNGKTFRITEVSDFRTHTALPPEFEFWYRGDEEFVRCGVWEQYLEPVPDRTVDAKGESND